MQLETAEPGSTRTTPPVAPALSLQGLHHHYGSVAALNGLDLTVPTHTIHGILGPNGCGKTTLFRLISTLVRVQAGTIQLFGQDIAKHQAWARQQIGIVFQAPSLDKKLTVLENIRCQAALYGLHGSETTKRIQEVMSLMGIADRANVHCEKLSGGLMRRVELAKGMLHRPRLLLLDEPSTGLDPAARLDLWHALSELKAAHGVTVVMTTHLLEEAEKCDHLTLLHQGKIVAEGTPESLRREAGKAILTIVGANPAQLAERLSSQLGLNCQVNSNALRLTRDDAVDWIGRIAETLGDAVESITVARPSLEDVFIARTGHHFWEESN